MVHTRDKPILGWDSFEVTDGQANFLKEQDPKLTDDEAFEQASEDPEIIGMAWDDLLGNLSAELERKAKPYKFPCNWLVEVENLGWRGRDGHTTVDTCDAREFLSKILPDTENTFDIFDEGVGRLLITNTHHDTRFRPGGPEKYRIRHLRAREVETDIIEDD